MNYLKLSLISFLTLCSVITTCAEALHDGLQYWKTTTPAQQNVQILKVDPARLRIIAAHANGKALGRESIATIAKRYHAIAAINGGFFKSGEIGDGLPAGILKIRNQWYGVAYRSRAAIGWSSQLQIPLIDCVQTKTTIYLNHQKFPLHAVNQPGSVKKAILYTEAYGKYAGSLLGGYDIVIQDHKIIKLVASGHTPIPKGGYIYSIGAKVQYPRQSLDLGNPATVNIVVIPQLLKEHYLAWQLVDNIIGGSPLLIYRGKIVQDHSMERLRSFFVVGRHARTAVGILPNGHWILAVAEQNILNGSPGMTIAELAIFMKNLGCEYALNLDGGSSSALYLDNSITHNRQVPKDEGYEDWHLRPISDALLILPQDK